MLLDTEFRRNTGWGVFCYNHPNGGPVGRFEMRNCIVRENSSGVQLIQYFTEVILAGNTISDQVGVGLEWQVQSGQLGAGGISGNTIRSNQVGIRVTGGVPAVLALSGNDIDSNRDFEIQNQSAIAVTATNCYWGEPTSTELNQNQVNLSRIYDQRDNGSYGLVTFLPARFVPIGQISGTAPTITQQPQPRTVLAGSTVTFAVAASGTSPFTYQWRKNGNPINGAQSSALALVNVQAGDAGAYSVLVSNGAGTATSANATLTVVPATANLAVRTITRTGDIFTVSLAVSPPAGAGFGFVQEVLPAGFTANGISAGGTYNALTRTVLWGPLPDNQIHQLAYTLSPPPGFNDSATLNGTAYFFGAAHAVTGDSILSTLPPDPRARLAMTRVFGIWSVSIEGVLGRSHRLEVRDSLTSGQWEPLAIINMTQSPRVYIAGDSIGKAQRFYRAVLLP